MSEKEKETIIKEPRDVDVLLGQGHYRHPGNQRLNELVDAKVEEYRKSTRPFKTYMAHDIINRLRNKGVRFLKELAPKGWIVVTDDKEAREKVAQRFQYMIRKSQGTASSDINDNDASRQVGSIPSTIDIPMPPPTPQSSLVWNGITVKIPFLPVFHQLQKTSVMVDDDSKNVSRRILECESILNFHETFNREESHAILSLPAENLKIRMNLWKALGASGIIVELINVEGDPVAFQKNARYILEAATGLFDRYKHTLLQSMALAHSSVQDYVSSFSAIKESAARTSDNKDYVPSYEKVRQEVQEVTKRMQKEAALAPKRVGFVRPTMKLSEPKIAATSSDAKSQSSEIVNAEKAALTGSFASAFSRWEAGNVSEKSIQSVTRKAEAKLIASAGAKGIGTGFASSAPAGPTEAVARKQQSPPVQNDDMSATAKQPNSAPSKPSLGNTISINPVKPEASNFVVADTRCSNAKLESGTPFGARPRRAVSEPELKTSCIEKGQSVSVAEDVVMPTNTDETETYRSKPKRRGKRSFSLSEEMKCDRSFDGKHDAEASFMDQTNESMKRLSLSSYDASHNDGRTRGEALESFSMTFCSTPNQEMKCDDSLDDGILTDGISMNSFLPSAFFGDTSTHSRGNSKAASCPSPANSLCSHISIEMRSAPSRSTSLNSRVSRVDAFSLPSSTCSFNSKCSLGKNSLRGARTDEALSPSMFQSDQESSSERVLSRDQPTTTQHLMPMLGLSAEPSNVPPTIFVNSSSESSP